MPINRRILSQDAAVAAVTDSAEGLVLHLDANDEDSIESGGANTGSGSGTWFDITNHDLNVPLVDKASNLKVHLNASDTTSYSGSGSTWTDISGSGLDASISGASFGSDTRGYFDFSGAASDLITIPDSSFVDMESNSTMEVWLQKPTATSHIINKGAGDGNESYALWASSSVIYFYRYDSGSGSTTGLNISTSSIATDEYMHVVVTVGSSGDFKMYLNGGSQVSDSISSFRDNSNSVRIGNFNTSNQYPYTEKLSVVRFYNTVLTASEVAQNYRAGNFLSYDSPYTTDVLVDYRPSNYVSGTTLPDVSGNSNTANLLGGIESTYDKELGDSFDLAGGSSGDRIESGTSVSFNTQTDGMTVEIWFKPDADSQSYIWSADQSGTTEFNISIRTGREIQWFYQDTSGQHILSTGSSAYALNEWHCIICTTDGSTAEMYLDGVLEDSHSTQAESRSFSGDLYFGDYFGGSNGYYGMLGTCRFWKKGLTAAQAYQNYLATKNDYPNAYHATIDGATFSATTPAYFDLDGSNDHIDTTFKNTALEEFTISAYIRFGTLPASNAYFINDTTNANEYSATFLLGYLASNGNWILHIGNGSSGTNGTISVSSGMEANHWTHIVFTCDGINDTVKYYKNGSLSATMLDGTATNIGSFSNTGTMQLGRFVGANNFHTDIDFGQFKIFNKTLSASEVLAEFNATKTPYPAADFT